MRTRRILRIAAIALAGVVLVIGGALVALDSAAGKRFLLAQIKGSLAGQGIVLETENVGGSLFDRLTVDRFSVADQAGSIASGENLILDWSPLRLLGGDLHVATLSATSLRLDRLPESAKEPSEPDPDSALLPDLPVDVAIDALHVGELIVGPSVPGGPASYALDAASELAGGRVTLHLDARDTDASGLVATADFLLDVDANQLDAAMRIDAPPGGALQQLIGLDGAPALSATLTGRGTLDDWQGALVADGGDALSADLALSVAGSDPWRIAVRGPLSAPGLLPAEWQFAAAPALALDADLSVTEDGAIDIVTLQAGSGALQANVGGTRAADGALDLTVDATLQGAAGWNAMVAPVRFSTLTIDGTLTGTEAEPVLDANVTVDGPALERATADALSVQMTLGLADGRASFDVDGQFARLVGDPRLIDGTSEAPNFALRGSYDLANGTVELLESRFDLASLQLAADGTIVPAPISADLNLDGMAADLSVLGPLLGMELGGSATLQGIVQTDGDGIAATLTATGNDLTFADMQLNALLGGTAELAAEATFDERGLLTLETLSLGARGLAFDASGTASLGAVGPVDDSDETGAGGGALDIQYTLSMPAIAPLAPSLAGALSAEGHLTGSPDNPGVTTTAQITGLVADGTTLGDYTIDATLTGLASSIAGDIAIDGPSPAGRLGLTLALVQESDRIRFDGVDLRVGGHSRARGALVLLTESGLVDGRLDLRIDALDAYSALAGVSLDGGFDGTVTLQPQDGVQRVAIEGTAASPSVEGIAADRVLLDVAALLGEGAPILSGTIEGSEIVTEQATLDTVTVTFEGTGDGFGGHLAVAGEMEGPLELDADFRIATGQSDVTVVEITSLDGTVWNEPLVLTRPARIETGTSGLIVQDLAATFGPASIAGTLSLAEDRVAGSLAVDDLPASWFDRLTDAQHRAVGTIDLDVTLAGTGGNPLVTATADIEGLAAHSPRYRDEAALDGQIRARYEAGRLTVDSNWTGLGDAPFDVAGTVPLTLSLAPFAAEIPPQGLLEGHARWNGDVRHLLAIVPIDPHRLEGPATIDLQFSGTVATPEIAGSIRMEGGEYENLSTGTLLTELDLAVTAVNRRDLSFELDARDGSKGTVTAQGHLAVDPARNSPFEVVASLQHAKLVRRDDVKVTATGDVRLEGTVESAALTGAVTVDRIDGRIDAGLSASVTELPVTEINRPDDDGVEEAPPVDPGVPFALSLDVQVDIPNQAYLRGRGLDSEWQGHLHVTGTADQPRIVGELVPRRGTFSFVGETFDIEDSRIVFDGNTEIDPRLDISAVADARDLEAIVTVTGRASNPAIAFSSRPPLPQDEVMARLLFGRRAGELSPLEAVQLAQALRTLSGQGDEGGGIVNFVRKTIGVDALTVGGTDGGVGVGQYLTDRVRVGVAQRFESGGTAGTVEIELTDDISVETEIGGQDSRVGVSWGYDY